MIGLNTFGLNNEVFWFQAIQIITIKGWLSVYATFHTPVMEMAGQTPAPQVTGKTPQVRMNDKLTYKESS
jgi:hypothetical protein